MSSLWTPGGEVPVDRDRSSTDAAAPDSEDEVRSQVEELRRRLVATPASEIVLEHAMGLYELAALHLTQPEPRLVDARLAIDALGCLVDGLGERLGPASASLRDALAHLQLAAVQASSGSGTPST